MHVVSLTGNVVADIEDALCGLVRVLSARGLSVSVVLQAAAGFEIDQPGKDSHRHREAGAREVIVSSARRWALMGEPEAASQGLAELLCRLTPADIVLLKGFDRERPPHCVQVAVSGAAAGTRYALIAPPEATAQTFDAIGPLTDAIVRRFELSDRAA